MRKQLYCILPALCQLEDFCRRRGKLLLAMMNSFACREHCVRLQANAMFPTGKRLGRACRFTSSFAVHFYSTRIAPSPYQVRV